MVTLSAFNPTGRFQIGQSNALAISAAGDALVENRANAPLRLKLNQLRVGSAQAMAGREQRADQQAQAITRAKILGQTAEALLGVPVEQRPAAFKRIEPHLEQFGIPVGTFKSEYFTDDNLMQAIAASRALIGNPDLAGMTTGQRDFASMTTGLTPEDVARARRIELGLDPHAVGSSTQTIAAEGTVGTVAAVERKIAGARERGKLGEQLIYKPMIAEAVKLAEARAAALGETLTSLGRARAALPGLHESVAALRKLAPLATVTIAGKVFNQLAKQLGFGATEGATARSTFEAIVNNQILPLLRDTFGAAFTAKEGESLKATMGNIDATPEEKLAVLDAFIAQKIRDIETKQREIDQGSAAPDQGGVQEGTTAVNTQTGQRIIYTNGNWQPIQ